MRTAFFDRDGVINVDVAYLSDPAQFIWQADAYQALLWLKQQGWRIIVVTNQSGVARGYYKETAVQQLHTWLNRQLQAAGAAIDAFYYCPHLPEATVTQYRRQCSCRKPAPGMLLAAMRDFGFSPEQAFMIGDKNSDMAAAAAAGVRGWLYTGGSVLALVQQAAQFCDGNSDNLVNKDK